MRYNVRAWVVDGTVKCASQLCFSCPYQEIHDCKPMQLLDEEDIGKDIMLLREKIKQIDKNNLGK